MRLNVWTAMILLVCAGALLGASLLTAVCVSANHPWKAAPADCLIVLGARVKPDGRMSNALLHRCEAALAAWRDGTSPVFIVCGGRGGEEPVAEADAMRSWLMAQGVPEEAIRVDDQSLDTRANLEHARAIMAENGFATAALCTSDYHMRRALWIARDAGIRTTGGVASPSPRDKGSWVASRLRETCSWILYFLKMI